MNARTSGKARLSRQGSMLHASGGPPMSHLRSWGTAALLALFVLAHPLARQAAQVSSADQQIFEAFRAWMTGTPDSMKGDVEVNYRNELKRQGVGPAEIDRRLTVIREIANRTEADRWNRILTAPKPSFNTKPNAFLVDMVRDVKPGDALDIGM